jgi:hypothetical protein
MPPSFAVDSSATGASFTTFLFTPETLPAPGGLLLSTVVVPGRADDVLAAGLGFTVDVAAGALQPEATGRLLDGAVLLLAVFFSAPPVLVFGLICSVRAFKTDAGRFDTAAGDALMPAVAPGRTGGADRGRAAFPLPDAFGSDGVDRCEDMLLAFDAMLSILVRIGSDLVAFMWLLSAVGGRPDLVGTALLGLASLLLAGAAFGEEDGGLFVPLPVAGGAPGP